MSFFRRALPVVCFSLLSLGLLVQPAAAGASSSRRSVTGTVDQRVAMPRRGGEAPARGQPNLLSFGGGWFDADSGSPDAVDARFEYRWGISLISAIAESLRHWDRYVQLHPMAGIESSTRGQFYGFGGLGADVMLFENLILTPSLAVGYYARGNGADLGDPFEARLMGELAYRFQNDVRTSVYWSHTSNWGAGDKNPGAQAVGVYLHVPVHVFFGR